MEEIKGNEIDLGVDASVEYDDDFVAEERLDEAIDNKELMKGQMELTPVEDKAREVQDPVYADASREMEKTREVKEKTLAVEKAPEHEENPKTPDMNPGAKEMKLEEAVNEFSETTLTDIDDDFEEIDKVEEVEEACEAFEMMDKEKEVNFEYDDEDAWIAEETEEGIEFDRDDDFEEYEDEKLFDFDDDFDEVEESVGHRVETGFIGVPDIEDAQSIVNQAVELFKRVPAGLYDDLDVAGFYVDADNKVHKKIEEDFGDEEIGEKERVEESKCEEVKKETATIKTPRGTITLSGKTEDELKGEGYGYWFTARVDGKEYRVLNNGTSALAVEVKAELEEEVDVSKWASNILEFPSGDYLYVDYDDGKLIAGGATNTGIIHDFELDYDETKSEDKNIQALYDKIIEERPEYLGEEVESLEEALDKKTDSQINEELINDEFDEFMKLAKKLGIETLADLQRVMNEPEARFNGTELERLQAYAKEANPRGLYLRNDEELEEAHREPADEWETSELVLYIHNDSDLYDRNTMPVVRNLARKMAKGTFEKELAKKAFKYVVDAGVQKYRKELPVEDGYEAVEFNPATREEAAEQLLEIYMERIEEIAEELKKKNSRVEEEYEVDDKEIIDKFEDDGDIHKIVKAPNGRYFNEYSVHPTNYYGVFIPSSIAGPYETEEEAREFMAKHRPKAKKVEKEIVTEEVEDKKVKFDYALIEFMEGGPSTDTPAESNLRKAKEWKVKFRDLDELGDLIFGADKEIIDLGRKGTPKEGYDKLYVDFYGKANDGTEVNAHGYRVDLGDGGPRENHLTNEDIEAIENRLTKEYEMIKKESVAVNEELTDEEKHEEEVEEGEGIVALHKAIKNEKAHGRDPMECYPIAKAFEDEKKKKIEESLSNEKVEEEIRKGIREYFDNWDDDEYRDFIEDYLVVEVKPFKGYDNDGTGTKVEVRAELSDSTLDEIIDEKLDPIIKKYDEEAYFDHDDYGIISAVIWDR